MALQLLGGADIAGFFSEIPSESGGAGVLGDTDSATPGVEGDPGVLRRPQKLIPAMFPTWNDLNEKRPSEAQVFEY